MSTETEPQTPADFDDEIEGGCGYSYDHTLAPAETVDGITVQECRECGAEIITDEEA